MKKISRIIKISTFALLVTTVIQPLSLIAQARRGGTVASNKAGAAPKCSGAWTGVVSYSRKQTKTNNKKVERVSGRGHDTTNWEMKYDYNAKVSVVESPEKNGSSIGKATIKHDFSSIETVEAVEKNSCDRGKTWKDMRGSSSSETTTTANEKTEANVNVGVNSDGTYTVSVALPKVTGEAKGKQESSYSGQCTPKEGKTFNLPPTPTSVDGNSLTSDGTHKVNPDDANRLSGSYTYTWQDVTETITWNLMKCGAPLRFTDLKFEDMKFPNWNDWQAISEQKGTIDGNLVKIKAKVLNASGEEKFADIKFKETYKGDKWDGARPDAELKDETVSVRVEPGEEKEVEVVWDSSGYAWYDDGRPRLVQRVKAELEENGKKVDDMTKNLKVAPKPLVLVHGLWSNWKAWETWQNILTTSHSYDWKAFPVGEKADKGVMNTGGSFLSTDKTNTIFENSQQLGKYIRYAQEDRNAWHVDIVAHSMGGLISRHYIHHFMAPTQDGKPQISKLVMLGTPNMGSPCADVMNSAFEFLGQDVEAVRQLRQDVAAEFNRTIRNRKGVKFSVLAGEPLPTMCKEVVWNDGVVPVQSAIWEIADNAKSKSVHTELTGTSDFSSFVKPRLAIGPKGNHNPEVNVPTGMSIYPSEFGRRYGASAEADNPYALVPASWAKAVKVPAKGSIEIDLPVSAAANFGVTFMAASDISVTLLDDKGMKVGSNLSTKPESRGWFRSISIGKQVAAGIWKLKIDNASERELDAVFTSWMNAVK